MTTIAESSKIENLKSMLAEMDQALCDEIEEQTRFPRREHTGVGGELLSESNGQYIYSFTLIEPWEPQDDTPLLVANAPTPISCTVVNSKGNQLIIASDSPLPQNILQQIELCDDSTELTKHLREVLKKVDEGEATLGSKGFGLFSYNEQSAPYNLVFGRLRPHPCQLKAAQMALGGEVTYIIGPPGTGKTFTLAAIALEHLRLGRTVLLTSAWGAKQGTLHEQNTAAARRADAADVLWLAEAH